MWTNISVNPKKDFISIESLRKKYYKKIKQKGSNFDIILRLPSQILDSNCPTSHVREPSVDDFGRPWKNVVCVFPSSKSIRLHYHRTSERFEFLLFVRILNLHRDHLILLQVSYIIALISWRYGRTFASHRKVLIITKTLRIPLCRLTLTHLSSWGSSVVVSYSRTVFPLLFGIAPCYRCFCSKTSQEADNKQCEHEISNIRWI